MSSDSDQTDRSLEEKAHSVEITQTTSGPFDSVQLTSCVPPSVLADLDNELATGSTTLADESPVECPSELVNDEKKTQVKAISSRRGRSRTLSKVSCGLRSRSVSRSWNNKKVTFTMKEKPSFKPGISTVKARNKRASIRCQANNEEG